MIYFLLSHYIFSDHELSSNPTRIHFRTIELSYKINEDIQMNRSSPILFISSNIIHLWNNLEHDIFSSLPIIYFPTTNYPQIRTRIHFRTIELSYKINEDIQINRSSPILFISSFKYYSSLKQSRAWYIFFSPIIYFPTTNYPQIRHENSLSRRTTIA